MYVKRERTAPKGGPFVLQSISVALTTGPSIGAMLGTGMQQASEPATTIRSLDGQIGENCNGRRDTEDNTRSHTEDTQASDQEAVQGVSEVSTA